MPQNELILVTGATGRQGGAVARSLLRDGWAVRAMVRVPHAPVAMTLEALGAELVTGDLDDLSSLRTAMRDAHGVYSVQPMPDLDERRGVNVADAALAAGVAHFVYSSVAGAECSTGIAHFETKARVEAHLAALGLPATVLRPVFFMENWHAMLPEAMSGVREAEVPLALDTSLQMIAVSDIGRIAADVFARRDEFLGRTLQIAGDELPVRRIAEIFAAVHGVRTRFRRQSIEDLRAVNDAAARMFQWIDERGFRTDLPSLRKRYPGLLTFEEWLAQ